MATLFIPYQYIFGKSRQLFISLLHVRRGEVDVEWGFAFDVHLNAFFPLLVILHFVQLFFYHLVISREVFLATLFGNTLWLVALGYYIYITFLGYR